MANKVYFSVFYGYGSDADRKVNITLKKRKRRVCSYKSIEYMGKHMLLGL